MGKLKVIPRIERGIRLKKSQIDPNPWNPNKTKDRQQEAIAESLHHYGQVLEILVRPHPDDDGRYQVIDGEHRLEELPENEVYVNVIHEISDADAKKLTIILNETRGEADKVELAQLLSDIQMDLGDDLIIGLPYDSTELEELIKLSEVNWDQFGSDGEYSGEFGGTGSGDEEWKTLTVKVPASAMERIQDAYNLIDQERNGLHSKPEIAWGQVLESLAADYLAGAS